LKGLPERKSHIWNGIPQGGLFVRGKKPADWEQETRGESRGFFEKTKSLDRHGFGREKEWFMITSGLPRPERAD